MKDEMIKERKKGDEWMDESKNKLNPPCDKYSVSGKQRR